MFGSSSTFNSSAFGSSTQSPFGAKPAGGLTFGSTGGFGQAASSTPATGFGASNTGTSLFGSTQAKPAFGSGTTFGATPAPAPAFGAASTGTSAFGQTASPFGSTGTTAFGAAKPTFGAPAASPFGAPAPAPAFGASASTGGLFGSKPSPFGATASTGSTTFGFGSTSTQPATGFGATSASPFGATASPFGASATGSSAFGATTSSLFSSTPAPAPAAFGGSMFGGAAQTGTSTYSHTDMTEGSTKTRMMSISAMEQYKTKSFEELRCEDYARGNKGGTAAASGFGAAASNPFGGTATAAPAFGAAPAPAASPFGAAAPAAAPGAFTFGASKPAFGATGTTPAFGAAGTTPAFGATGTTPAFGSTGAFGSTATAAKPFSFGAAAPAASPFGATQPSATPAFGTQSTFGQTTGTGFGFGAAPAAAPAFGAPATGSTGGFSFGATKPTFATPTTAGSAFSFGATKPATGFGAAGATGFSFGATAPAPAATGGLFGSSTFGSTGASGFSFGGAAAKPAGSAFSFGSTAAAPATSLFGAKPAGTTLFGSTTPAFGQTAAVAGQATNQILVGAHNQNAFGIPGTSLGSGNLAQKLDAVEARSSQLEIRLDPGARPLLVTAKGNPEHAAVETSTATGLPSYKQSARGVARIKPRGMSNHSTALGPSPALARLKSEGLSSSQVFSPDAYTGSTAKKLQIKPDAHKPRSVSANGVRGRIDFSAVAAGNGVEETKESSPAGGASHIRGPVVLGDGGSVGPTPSKSPHQADHQLQTPLSGSSSAVPPAPPSSGGHSLVPPSPERTAHKEPSGPARPTPRRPSGVYTPFVQKVNGAGTPEAEGAQYETYSDFYHEVVKPPEASPEAVNSASKDFSMCPILTRHQYYTEPAYDEMQQMSEEELASMPGLTVGRKGYGKIHWDGILDVRGLDLDRLIRIEEKEVSVYEDIEDHEKPPVGEELNRPAIITLNGIFPPEDMDPAKYAQKIQKRTKKMDADFIDYNPDKGEWTFRTKHFSRYGLVDSDDSEEEEDDANLPPNALPGTRKQLQIKPAAHQTGMDTFDAAKNDDQSMEPVPMTFDDQVERPSTQSLPEHLGLNTEGVRSLRLSMGGQGPSTTMFSPQQSAEPRQVESQSRSQGPASPWGPVPAAADLMESVPRLALALPDAEQAQNYPAVAAPPKQKLRAFYPLAESRTAQLLKETANDLQKKLGNKRLKVRTDYGQFMGRSFRVGWGPNGELIHPGRAVFGSTGTGNSFGAKHTLTMEKINTVPSRISDKASEEEMHSHFLPLLQIHMSASMIIDEAKKNIKIDAEEMKVATRFGLPSVTPFSRSPPPEPQAYRRWVACVQHFATAFEDQSEIVVTEAERVVSRAWALTNALFGQERTSFSFATATGLMPVEADPVSSQPNQLRRKEMISAWLKDTVAPRVPTTASDLPIELEAVYARIFECLSAHQLSEAVAAAQKGGCFRLASLIAQASDPIVRDMILLQVNQWYDSRAVQQISPGLLKVYTVLSGKYGTIYRPMHHELARAGQVLDWQRHLGLYLWYQVGPDESIHKAMEEYDEAVAAAEAPSPRAWYMASSPGDRSGDGSRSYPDSVRSANAAGLPPAHCITYHLMKLYCSPGREYPLTAVVDPRTMTQDLLDYRYSWHFLTVLRKLNGLFPVEPGTLVAVTNAVVFQLLSCGLWEWACYCLTHLPNDEARTRGIREVLNRYGHGAQEEPEVYLSKCNFLLEDLHLPPEWLKASQAQYLRAHCPEEKRNIAACLMESYQWEQAHSLICTRILPKAVLRSRGKGSGPCFDKQLMGWLQKLEEQMKGGPKAELAELWEAPGGGALYLAYARLLEQRAALMEKLARNGLTEAVLKDMCQLFGMTFPLLDRIAAWSPPVKFWHCLTTPEEKQLEVVCRAEMNQAVFQFNLLLAEQFEHAEYDTPEVQPMLHQSMVQFASCAVLSDYRAQKMAQIRDDFIHYAVTNHSNMMKQESSFIC